MQNKQGFTLIELSIVLIIIGLVIGGVLVGRDLIASAEIRAQISQIDAYQAAVNTFKLKYGYLPGDIPGATATGFGLATRAGDTARGDGNGLIDGGCASTAHRYGCETALFWKDLSDVSLISDDLRNATYTGSLQTISAATGMSGYLPVAKIGASNFVAVYTGGGNNYNVKGLNYFLIAAITSTNGSGDYQGSKTMTPNQAYAIDSKVDDGIPQSGLVKTVGIGGGITFDTSYSTAHCATSASQYNISSANVVSNFCSLALRLK